MLTGQKSIGNHPVRRRDSLGPIDNSRVSCSHLLLSHDNLATMENVQLNFSKTFSRRLFAQCSTPDCPRSRQCDSNERKDTTRLTAGADRIQSDGGEGPKKTAPNQAQPRRTVCPNSTQNSVIACYVLFPVGPRARSVRISERSRGKRATKWYF